MVGSIHTIIIPETVLREQDVRIQSAVRKTFIDKTVFGTDAWIGLWADADHWQLFYGDISIEEEEETTFNEWFLSSEFKTLCDQGLIIWEFVG